MPLKKETYKIKKNKRRSIKIKPVKTKKIKYNIPLPSPTIKDPTQTFQHMNCAPIVKYKNKASNPSSCLSDDIIYKLKNDYNRGRPLHTQIKATTPAEIWQEFKMTMKECNKEKCWLKNIRDENMQKKIEEMVFAPEHPDDWNDNPNEWVSNYDIFYVLKQYEIVFPHFESIEPAMIDFGRKNRKTKKCVREDMCAFSITDLLRRKKTKIGIVFNLADSKSEGSHWVSMFIDIENRFIFYLDSGGDTAPYEILRFVEKIQKQATKQRRPFQFDYYENAPNSHQQGSSECGMYALFFIITMLTGETDFDKNMTVKERIHLFKDKQIPDKYVSKYRNIYFNKPE